MPITLFRIAFLLAFVVRCFLPRVFFYSSKNTCFRVCLFTRPLAEVLYARVTPALLAYIVRGVSVILRTVSVYAFLICHFFYSSIIKLKFVVKTEPAVQNTVVFIIYNKRFRKIPSSNIAHCKPLFCFETNISAYVIPSPAFCTEISFFRWVDLFAEFVGAILFVLDEILTQLGITMVSLFFFTLESTLTIEMGF